MKIEILTRANDDILRQFRYYLVDRSSEETSRRFREAVRTTLDRLRKYPWTGVSFQGSIPRLRSWPVKDFENIRIYYRENSEVLQVLRVLHGKRNVRRILKQSSR